MARKHPDGFYVYLHRRKTDGLIFYVGKGTKYRAYYGFRRSPWWSNVSSKHGFTCEILKSGMSECCAFSLERILIAKYRSLGHPLVNLTDGGDGVSGEGLRRASEASREVNSITVYSSLGEVFPSFSDAAENMRRLGYPSANNSKISSVCSGKKKTVYGRAWSTSCRPPHPGNTGRKSQVALTSKKLRCSNGMEFPSTVNAVSWLQENGWPRASSGSISKAARGISKNAYGFEWGYV